MSVRAQAADGSHDDEMRVVVWAAVIGSLGIHLMVYFALTPFWPGPIRDAEPSEWMVMIDDGTSGAGQEAAPEEAGARGDAYDEIQSSIETPEQITDRMMLERPEPIEAPEPEEEIEVADTTSETVVEPEQAIEEVESQPAIDEVRDIPTPEETANNLFLDALMARGNGGASNVGAGDGTGGGRGSGDCSDPILGTWRAKRYDRVNRRHATFTIRVTHTEGHRLEGNITLRAWSGGPLQTSPPRCEPGVWDHTVRMPAHGRFNGRDFRMDAESHRRTTHCMDMGIWMYNLDHFSGTMNDGVLTTVNNDGGIEVNSPYRFRRVSCL